MENNFKNKFNDNKKQMTFEEWIISLNTQADNFIKKLNDADKEMFNDA